MRTKGRTRKIYDTYSTVRGLEEDFKTWMTPSDWDAQICLNPRICNKADVASAEKTIGMVHAIVEDEMNTMRTRLLVPRSLSAKEQREMNKLSSMPFEEEIPKWKHKCGPSQVPDTDKPAKNTLLPGIRDMLLATIKEAALPNDTLRPCVRHSFEVFGLLDEAAPVNHSARVGERLLLTTPAAVHR